MHHLNAFPTSSTFHFNIILNINIILSQWRYQQQQPHSISTSSHINLKSSIATSTVSHIPHVHISFMPKIHTPHVFKQHKSNKNNNFIHQMYIHISHPIRRKHGFLEKKFSMQQGQTYILIARFLDPNHGVETVNL